MKYRYLTFDCYGTLIDWKTGIEEQLRAALGAIDMQGRELLDLYVNTEKGQESTYKKYREVLSGTARGMSTGLGVPVSEEAAERFAASVPSWPAFPDTNRFLHNAGEMGYKRFILSNVDDDLLRGTIEINGLEVDGFVTAEQVRSYKPNHAHWLEFMSRTGAGKGEVLHVAQSLFHDIAPTQDLGIDSAWVNRYNESLPSSLAPSYMADSLAGLALTLG